MHELSSALTFLLETVSMPIHFQVRDDTPRWTLFINLEWNNINISGGQTGVQRMMMKNGTEKTSTNKLLTHLHGGGIAEQHLFACCKTIWHTISWHHVHKGYGMDKDVVVYFPFCQGRQMVGMEQKHCVWKRWMRSFQILWLKAFLILRVVWKKNPL